MTIAHPIFARGDQTPRWLILTSLAFNLFFIGLSGAYLVNQYSIVPGSSPSDRSVAARIDRIAAALPAADAEKLQAQFGSQAAEVEATRDVYRRAQESVRAALRSEPFNIDGTRLAMAEMRRARQTFDTALHGVIAGAAAQMTAAGRTKLAAWPPTRREPTDAKR